MHAWTTQNGWSLYTVEAVLSLSFWSHSNLESEVSPSASWELEQPEDQSYRQDDINL